MPDRPSDTGDLRRSEAGFWRAATKVLAVIAAALIPALIGWIDAKTKATSALAATATERATSDKAYVQLVHRLNRTEKQVQALVVEIGLLEQLLQVTATPTATTTESAPAPLPDARPSANPHEVDQARQKIMKEF